ncbi:MAG TPA: aspartyl protease family protein [Edaphobacter sp.]|nr:aspartyl protease family protein [Edaphobacter sp.]
MRLVPLLALPVMLLTGQLLNAQRPDALKAAYEANQVFALRDAVSRSAAPLLYRGAVNASSNSVRAAEADLRSVIQHDPHSDDAYKAHDLLGNMYFRNGMYREGYAEIVAALHERPDASDAKSMLSILTALNVLPKMTVVEAKPTSIDIEPGSTFLPLKANGKDLELFFDTGAPISVIGESEAKELGIVAKPVEGKMGDTSGQGVSGIQLALVSDLRIGGLHLRDVPFVVVADSGEPWSHLRKNRHGIIGLPLLLAMHTIRWTPTGKFEFGFPGQTLNLSKCNMLFHNSNPVIDVLVDSKHLDFTLDTGAVDTDLNPQFAKALPALMNSGTPETRSIEGLGGKVENSSILLPSVTFEIGGKSVVLRPAHVFTEHGNGTWASGNLGMDLLRQAHAFTLDFGAMTLRLQ